MMLFHHARPLEVTPDSGARVATGVGVGGIAGFLGHVTLGGIEPKFVALRENRSVAATVGISGRPAREFEECIRLQCCHHRKYAGTLDDMPQLAHVSGPRVGRECLFGRRRKNGRPARRPIHIHAEEEAAFPFTPGRNAGS